MRFTALLGLFCLIFVSPALAADINADGAAHLKTMFENIIANQQKLSSATKGGAVSYQGEITVEPADSYYAVTMPHTLITYPDGRKADIGMVSINASPHDAPGQWKMSVAMPTPITVFEKDGKKAYQIHIGGQRASGIWHEDIENFMKLDAQYKDITVQSFGKAFTATIPQAKMIYNLEKNKNNTWSGPAEISFSDLDIKYPVTSGSLKIKGFSGLVDITEYSPKDLKTYREKVLAMAENAPAGAAPSPQHVLGLYNMIFDLAGKATDGFAFNVEMSGLEVNNPANAKSAAENIMLGKARASFGMQNLKGNKATLSARLSYDDFKISPTSAQQDNLTPAMVNIDVSIKNLPLKDILQLSQNSLASVLEQPQMSKFMGAAFLLKLPALLSQAKTQLVLKDNRISNGSYGAAIDGQAVADITAMNSATANAKISVRNIDWLLAAIEKRRAESSEKDTKKLDQISNNLKVIKRLGREETQASGQSVHVVEFEMNGLGKMLINGEDALPLLKGAPAK